MPNDVESPAVATAKRQGMKEAEVLLERFVDNPKLTRQEIRGKLVAEVFTLIIFVCDDLLQSRPAVASSDSSVADDVARIFAIAKRLPKELQMMLSHLVFGSLKSNITSKNSEAAFRTLTTKILLLGHSQ